MQPELNNDDLHHLCQQQGLIHLACLELPLTVPSDRLDQMLVDGIGDMQWLQQHRALRLNPNSLLPEACRLLMTALPYAREPGNSNGLRHARYAKGKDYHKLLRKKLAHIGKALTSRYPDTTHRAAVDSAPLSERELGQIAGLGWIGKNALLLRGDIGSYFFIGSLLTSAPLPIEHGQQSTPRCGSCKACETRCPTAAIQDGRVLSTRCISYLTIEHHGIIPRDLAQHFNGWWFGCDLCQEVCPWNRFAPGTLDPALRGPESPIDPLSVTADSFDAFAQGRALKRVGYVRFRRNLLVALWSLNRTQDCRVFAKDADELVQQQGAELGLW